MERLTMWYDGNHAICTEEACTLDNCPFADAPCEHVQDVIDRLAAYADICFDADGKERITVEELSALVKARFEARDEGHGKIPPCGEIIFVLTDATWWSTELKKPEIIECRVTTHRWTKSGKIKFSLNGHWKSGNPYKATFGVTSLGKTVFLTRAEAEAALGGGRDGKPS